MYFTLELCDGGGTNYQFVHVHLFELILQFCYINLEYAEVFYKKTKKNPKQMNFLFFCSKCVYVCVHFYKLYKEEEEWGGKIKSLDESLDCNV